MYLGIATVEVGFSVRVKFGALGWGVPGWNGTALNRLNWDGLDG